MSQTKKTNIAKKKGAVEKHEDAIEPEVLDKLKPQIEQLISYERFSGPVPPQILEKITVEHISAIITQSGKDDERSYKYAKAARIWNFIYFGISIALLIFLTIFWGNKDIETYKLILQFIILFVGGIGFGKGFLSKRKNDQ